MGKWKLLSGVLLIFVLGGMVGALASAVYLKHKHPLFKRDPVLRTKFIMEKLSGRLDLTDQQKEKITVIVKGIEVEARENFLRHRGQMRDLLEKGIAEMKRELDPDQQRKLDRMREEYRKKKEKRRKADAKVGGPNE